jgi:hypothetical protein
MKGYKLKIGEVQYEQISEIFSINEQIILDKRNEIEQKYISEIIESDDYKLLSNKQFQKEVLKDFEWNHFGQKYIYINNPVVRYKNSNGEEITQLYCNYIDEDDITLDVYKHLTLKEIDILE